MHSFQSLKSAYWGSIPACQKSRVAAAESRQQKSQTLTAYWRWLRAALVIVITVGVLAGCTSLAPEYKRPTSPLPEHYTDLTGDQAAAGAHLPADQLAWQEFFLDSELRSLIERALAGNRDLRQALLAVEEARAAWGVTRAERLPDVGVNFDSLRGRVPGDLNFSGVPQTTGEHQLGVGFNSWELDLWGRVQSLNEATLQEYLATDEARRASTLLLVSQVANAWLGLLELDQRISLAENTLAMRQASRRVFQRRLDVGSASLLEYTQAELLEQQAASLLTQLQLERREKQHALALLVGDTGFELPTRSVALSNLEPFQELAPGLPAQLLESRPDIMAAERRLKAANANIGAARAAFFPRIALTTMTGTASDALNGLFSSGSRTWSFMPSISLPIFDGGRRQSNLDLAEVRQEQAVVQYEQTIAEAFKDVADALAARHFIDSGLRILRATEQTQQRRAELVNRRFDAGAARYFEVLDAERDLLDIQQQVVQVERQALSAQLALYTALGGGSAALAPVAVPAGASNKL